MGAVHGAVEAGVRQLFVTSAGSANGGGYGAILSFDAEGEPMGPFSSDPRIVDPRGLSLDPSGALIYLNSYDSVLEEAYFAAGAAANRRGYNRLAFDLGGGHRP